VPTPPKKMDDFCRLISKPDVLPKSDSCRRRHWTEEESPREKRPRALFFFLDQM
jgi:hypothetical protein